jgi:hypothetical protein
MVKLVIITIIVDFEKKDEINVNNDAVALFLANYG